MNEADEIRREGLEAAADIYDAVVAGTHEATQKAAVEAMSSPEALEWTRRYIEGRL